MSEINYRFACMFCHKVVLYAWHKPEIYVLRGDLFFPTICISIVPLFPFAAFATMAPIVFKHLVYAFSRQLAQMSKFNLTSSPTVAFRCLYGLTTAPRALVSSVKRSSIQSCWCSPAPESGPSLLGQCQHVPCIQPCAGMKTKSALKRRCKDCFFVVRRGRLFVYCKTNPRHKQRQG